MKVQIVQIKVSPALSCPSPMVLLISPYISSLLGIVSISFTSVTWTTATLDNIIYIIYLNRLYHCKHMVLCWLNPKLYLLMFLFIHNHFPLVFLPAAHQNYQHIRISWPRSYFQQNITFSFSYWESWSFREISFNCPLLCCKHYLHPHPFFLLLSDTEDEGSPFFSRANPRSSPKLYLSLPPAFSKTLLDQKTLLFLLSLTLILSGPITP